jgi:hypothetical protein
MRKSKQVTLSLDPAILARLDEERGLIPRSRYIAFIIESWFARKSGGEEAETPEASPAPSGGGAPEEVKPHV